MTESNTKYLPPLTDSNAKSVTYSNPRPEPAQRRRKKIEVEVLKIPFRVQVEPEPDEVPSPQEKLLKAVEVLGEKVDAALAAKESPAKKPSHLIPFDGTGPELADRIIREHHEEIEKARRAGKKVRRISDTQLILDRAALYIVDNPRSKRHGSPFIPENVRTSWLRSGRRSRDRRNSDRD